MVGVAVNRKRQGHVKPSSQTEVAIKDLRYDVKSLHNEMALRPDDRTNSSTVEPKANKNNKIKSIVKVLIKLFIVTTIIYDLYYQLGMKRFYLIFLFRVLRLL